MSVEAMAAAVAGRALRLPAVRSGRLAVRRGLGVRMRDGVILRTDHYAPHLPDAPTVLIRTPYGRTGPNAVLARLIAQRGFHVVQQSCRGTCGSGGGFDPLVGERDDGLDTVAWLRRQPWFTGRLGTFGPSYLGFAQWAIADVPELAAMATMVTASDFADPTYAGDSFSLHTVLAWAALVHAQSGPRLANALELLRGQPRLARALRHLPLGEADEVATGARIAFFRAWVGQAAARLRGDHQYWQPRGHRHRVPAVTAQVLMIGGWQDIFLPWQLRDYRALRDAGARPRLIIGPWTHGSAGLFAATVRHGLDWLITHLRGERVLPQALPVRVHVGGADRWRDLADWPPPGVRHTAWYLHSGFMLSRRPAAARPPTPARFRYDPADPTPAVGGPVLIANKAGQRDNRMLEARPDVLVYSSGPLTADYEVIGPVHATVYARASRPHFDIFVRLCDVTPDGVSRNVCDALARVVPGRIPVDGAGFARIELELWPAAHRFRAGHRLRVQVSGGAHPRYARNTGTGQPMTDAVALAPVHIQIGQDTEHPTAVLLPG
jgi:uncharacterized protein